MNKPIEEGCRAVIINSVAGNDGIIVTVGKFIGKVPFWKGDKRWEVDKTIYSNRGFPGNTMQEHQLRRIDDEKTTTWEQIAETCKYTPNRETA